MVQIYTVPLEAFSYIQSIALIDTSHKKITFYYLYKTTQVLLYLQHTVTITNI